MGMGRNPAINACRLAGPRYCTARAKPHAHAHATGGECTVSVSVPPGVEVSSREPMLSGAEHYRKTGVKFTGTRLTTKRGHTKRKK